jgi:hypothetical protein
MLKRIARVCSLERGVVLAGMLYVSFHVSEKIPPPVADKTLNPAALPWLMQEARLLYTTNYTLIIQFFQPAIFTPSAYRSSL